MQNDIQVSEISLILYESYSETSPKVSRSKRNFVFRIRFQHFENRFVYEVSNDKGLFSDLWITRQSLLCILMLSYILISNITKHLCFFFCVCVCENNKRARLHFMNFQLINFKVIIFIYM